MLQSIPFTVRLAASAARFILLDSMQQLGSFRATVADKGLHILLKAFHRILHLRIKALRIYQAVNQVVESLKHLLILCEHRIPLPSKAFIFRLLCFDPLILEKDTVSLGQLLHERSLLVGRLQQTVLVRSVLLKLGLKELILLV